MPQRPQRGQAQTLPANRWPALAGLRSGWMGLGYALRVPDAAAAQLRAAADAAEADWLLVGATYESPDAPLAPEAAWRDNCTGVAALAGGGTAPAAVPGSAAAPWLRSHVGVRAVSPDRLPYCGPVPELRDALAEPARWAGKRLHELPRHPGLAVCAGMGSRGLTLAALLAECIAAEIEGEPLPVETDLAACLDPARIALKRLRRS
jgi:tRNA 5-methylaminomethyl-2-thiouridine biosynthesis bifunctional protein